FLFLIFLFIEEKKENLKEETLWKLDFEKLSYVPGPKAENKKAEDYVIEPITFLRYPHSLKENPVFSISTSDKESGEIVLYEGGYNVKNLYSELTTLRIFSVAEADEKIKEKLGLIAETAPVLEFHSEGKKIKSLMIGNQNSDKSKRFFLTDKNIFLTHSFIFDKFRGRSESFRERQLLNVSTNYIKSYSYASGEKNLKIENSPVIENNSQKNSFTRTTGKKIIFDPGLGDGIDSALKSLRIDIYPDDSDGQGFSVANSLINTPPEKILDISIANGEVYRIKIFPQTEFKGIKYRPVVREIRGKFIESPGYIKEDSLKRLEELTDSIIKANAWTKPKPPPPPKPEKKKVK
ncbi:MAG: DUF4340 domain-containing protein, partial [Leptospira sp.]|nr:DUF4340 domain-containing protein [Leptospira sp.]